MENERTEAVDCIILAAGRSRRMGRWKMLLPVGDSTVVECAVHAALQVCRRVVLVVGYRGAELERLFSGREAVRCVRNPDCETGMFSSVRIGIGQVSSTRCFLALGDMPLVKPDTFDALLTGPTADCVVPVHLGRRGHPILISRSVFPAIHRAPADSTLRDVLRGFPIVAVPVDDPHILIDLDRPGDYEKL